MAREFVRRKYKTRQFYKQYVEPVAKPPPIIKETPKHILQTPPPVKDMITFDEPVIYPSVQPVVTQPSQLSQQIQYVQPLQQPIMTQEQINEIERQKKISNIMNMFNY